MKTSLLSMPPASTAATPAPSTLPGDLARALDRAQTLLDERTKVRGHLSDCNRAAPELLKAKLSAVDALAEAETALLLDEANPAVVDAARTALAAAEARYSRELGIGRQLKLRLIDPQAEADLIAARNGIADVQDIYIDDLADDLAAEYSAAAAALECARYKCEKYTAATGFKVPLPSPSTANTEPDADGTLTGLARFGSAVEGVSQALNEITNSRAQLRRESSARPPFSIGMQWQFIRAYTTFQVGDVAECPMLPEVVLEKLYAGRIVVPFSGAGAGVAAPASAQVA